MKTLFAISGVVLIAIGLFFAVGVVVGLLSGDGDIGTSGKVEVGLAYGVVALLLVVGGWALVGAARRR